MGKVKCKHKNVTKWKNGLRQCKDCLIYWNEKPQKHGDDSPKIENE